MAAGRHGAGTRRYDAKGPERGLLHLPRGGAPTAGYQGLVMLCGCEEGRAWKPAYWSLGDAVARRCKRCVRSVEVRARSGAGARGPRGQQLTLPLDV